MMPTSTPAVGKDTASLSSSSTNQRKSTHSGEHPKDYHLDTAVFKELAKRTLIEALNEIPGGKTLVLDPSLSGPLGLVIEPALLKQYGVEKLFWLEPSEVLTAPTKNVVWMCRPKISWMKTIASQIKAHSNLSSPPSHSYSILLVPRATELCRCILEEEGVLGDVTLKSYELGFLPVEPDVLSLELEGAARDIFLSKDETSVYYAAQALDVVQKAYGVIPRIVGKGDAAEHLSYQLQTLRQNDTTSYALPLSAEIDAMIVLDRSVDWLTPMCIQWTYEGLVDEVLGIKNSHVEVSESSTASTDLDSTSTPSERPTPTTNLSSSNLSGSASSAAGAKKKKHPLNSSDKVFCEIRDLPLVEVAARLNKSAKRIKDAYSQGRNNKDIAQIKDFVGKLSGLQAEHQALTLHTTLSETITAVARGEDFNNTMEVQLNLLSSYDVPKQQAAIEDLINQGLPFNTVLRLLIVLSVTTGGLKPKVYDAIRRELLQAYGYHHLPLLLSLSTLHLFSPIPTTPLPPAPLRPLSLSLSSSTTSSPPTPITSRPLISNPKAYTTLRKSLRLVVDPEELDFPPPSTLPSSGGPSRPDHDEQRPLAMSDISYAYSGYAPLSVRLVQCVAQKASVLSTSVGLGGGGGGEDERERAVPRAHPIVGWKGFEDVVGSLPGATFDHIQTVDHLQDDDPPITDGPPRQRDHTSTTLVFFLGGCTFAEISALRKMRKASKGRRFLICTTSIISGNSLLDSLAGPAPVPIEPTETAA